ncbi:Predicted arabinose efflux permease, MFS family [Sinosporangium album]|uniref:Predicted arabinose efflux permease, MFS family n=1 Tax=Sinosporangium album TaxID=504805 RepID=A0A1G7U765_9ACTN|nr:MFS transporter [Sinosporangium album]SDG43462.1 Predicted arabinose efflux permease, MFS family [Sinosporangium album]
MAQGPSIWSRDFRLFFAARTVSMLGHGMLPVATALGVQKDHGPTGVGLALAAGMAPMALLILFGGVFGDRFTPRRMMVGADTVRMLSQGCLAALFFTGVPALWQIILLSAITGAAAAMFLPGVASTVPRVARDVQQANAALRVSESVMQLVGPGLAGVLVASAGVGVVFAVEAGGFALSALCLLLMRVEVERDATAKTSVIRDLREGWTEFRSRTWMWSVILVWVVFGITLFGPMIPLGALLVTENAGESAYGLVLSAGGAGTILGGLVAMRLRPRRPLAAGAVAMFGFALQPLTIALAAPLPMVMAGFVLGGAGWAFWSVMWATSIQTHVAPDVLNRVSAYEIGGSIFAMPIGQALAGPIASLLGGLTGAPGAQALSAGATAMLWLSTAVTVTGLLTLLLIPAVRGLRRADPAPTPAAGPQPVS